MEGKIIMHNAGHPNSVVSLDRYRLAVTRNREYARRTGDEDYNDSELDAGIMRESDNQR